MIPDSLGAAFARIKEIEGLLDRLTPEVAPTETPAPTSPGSFQEALAAQLRPAPAGPQATALPSAFAPPAAEGLDLFGAAPLGQTDARGWEKSLPSREVAARMLTGRGGQVSSQAAEKVPAAYRKLVQEASRKYGVDEALILAVMQTESDFNPRCVSSAGAMGLMQLMPSNVTEYGISDAFDPAQNIDAGVRHLRDMLQRYDGDVKLALAGYNAGPGNVAKYGGVPPFAETRNYIPKVLARAEAFRQSPATAPVASGVPSLPPVSPMPVDGFGQRTAETALESPAPGTAENDRSVAAAAAASRDGETTPAAAAAAPEMPLPDRPAVRPTASPGAAPQANRTTTVGGTVAQPAATRPEQPTVEAGPAAAPQASETPAAQAPPATTSTAAPQQPEPAADAPRPAPAPPVLAPLAPPRPEVPAPASQPGLGAAPPGPPAPVRPEAADAAVHAPAATTSQPPVETAPPARPTASLAAPREAHESALRTVAEAGPARATTGPLPTAPAVQPETATGVVADTPTVSLSVGDGPAEPLLRRVIDRLPGLAAATQAVERVVDQVVEPVTRLVEQIRDAMGDGPAEDTVPEVRREAAPVEVRPLPETPERPAPPRGGERIETMLAQSAAAGPAQPAADAGLQRDAQGDRPTAQPAPAVRPAATDAAPAAFSLEQASRPQSATRADATAPVVLDRADQMPSEVVRRAQLLRTPGRDEFSVEVRHPEAGTINVRVVRDAEAVHVSLSCSHSGLRRELQAQLPALEAALREQGLQLGRFDTAPQQQHQTFQGGEYQQAQQQAPQHAAGQRGATLYGAPSTAASETEEEPRPGGQSGLTVWA